jgi:hypothetical protein
MTDMTGAQPDWKGHCGSRRIWLDSVPSRVDEHDERGGASVAVPSSLTASGEPYPLPVEWTSLIVSVAEFARGDITGERLTAPRKLSTGTQRLRGE